MAVESWDFESDVEPVLRWRRPVASDAWLVNLAMVALASSSWALRSSCDIGMALETFAVTAETADPTLPDMVDTAGLYTSSRISPRSLLPDGRSEGTETGPLASDTPR